MAVIHRCRYIITDADLQRPLRRITVGVADEHREVLAQRIGPCTLGMLFGTGQGIAVAHHARCRVVASDCQDIAQRGSDRLAYAGHHAGGHHTDAAQGEIEHTVRRHNGKAAVLGQGRWIAGRPQRQIGFIQARVARVELKPAQLNGMVLISRRQRGVRLAGRIGLAGWQTTVGATATTVASAQGAPIAQIPDIAIGKLRGAIEPGSRKPHYRVDPRRHFGQHHNTVATAQRPRRSSAVGAGCGCFAGFTWVGTRGNRLLNTLHIGELCRTWGGVLGMYRVRVMGQQVRGHLPDAVAPQRKFAATLQAHRHRTSGACLKLLACEQAVPFDQRATTAVAAQGEHLTDHLADHTD